MAGADVVRVLEQALERPVVERAAELEVRGPVHDDLQVRHLERTPQSGRVADAVPRVREHPDGRRGDLDPPKPAASIPFSVAAPGHHS